MYIPRTLRSTLLETRGNHSLQSIEQSDDDTMGQGTLLKKEGDCSALGNENQTY